MFARLFVFLLALLLPTGVWAQSQMTDSFEQRVSAEVHKEVQMFRCDNSGSIPGTGPIGGESCTSGNWTKPLDCRDQTNLHVRFHEYGAGSADAKIWDCLMIPVPPATTASTAGGSIPGTEAPAATPSAADPDPLCVSLDDSAGVTIEPPLHRRGDQHMYRQLRLYTCCLLWAIAFSGGTALASEPFCGPKPCGPVKINTPYDVDGDGTADYVLVGD
jgi:hypothetical protein